MLFDSEMYIGFAGIVLSVDDVNQYWSLVRPVLVDDSYQYWSAVLPVLLASLTVLVLFVTSESHCMYVSLIPYII